MLIYETFKNRATELQKENNRLKKENKRLNAPVKKKSGKKDSELYKK